MAQALVKLSGEVEQAGRTESISFPWYMICRERDASKPGDLGRFFADDGRHFQAAEFVALLLRDARRASASNPGRLRALGGGRR